jgi:hypothetical protein
MKAKHGAARTDSLEQSAMDLLGGIQRIENAGRGKRMRIWACFMAVALLLGCAGVPRNPRRERAAANRRVPRRQVLSPLGGYLVTSESPNRKSPEREIVVSRPSDKREIIRFPFRKQVDVVWAPDESGVAVVDLVLDNETRVVVFELPSGRPLYELRREHVCEWNPNLPCGETYTHVFFSNVVWLAPDRIQVTVDMVYPLQPNLPAQIRDTLIATFPR